MAMSRKKYLVDSKLQLHVIGTMITIAVTAALFQVVLLNKSVLTVAQETGATGQSLLSQLPSILSANVALTLGVLVPAMALVGMVMTHRIAGPAYAMEHYLRKVADEGLGESRCSIRQGDQMQGLCDALNLALERVASEQRLPEAGAIAHEPDDIAAPLPTNAEAASASNQMTESA